MSLLKPTAGTDKPKTMDLPDVTVELEMGKTGSPKGLSIEGLKPPSQWNFLDLLSFSWMNK